MFLKVNINKHKQVTKAVLNGEEATLFRDGWKQVFVLRNLIIKFDGHNHNVMESKSSSRQVAKELKIIKKIQKQDLKYFCVPLMWGEIRGLKFVIQEFVRRRKTVPTAEEWEELHNIIDKYGLNDVGHSDNPNAILTKDGWKIYDWGF